MCLTSCSAVRPTLITDPQLIRVPGPARYVPIDESLTEETPPPHAPAPLCVDFNTGEPVLCDMQLVLWIVQLQESLEKANVDKLLIRQISSQIVEDQEARSGGRD